MPSIIARNFRSKYLIFFISFLLIFLYLMGQFPVQAKEVKKKPEITNKEIKSTINEYLSDMKKKKYLYATNLFHYPPEYSVKTLKAYKISGMNFHKIINEELGGIVGHESYLLPHMSYQVYFESANIIYRNDHPEHFKISYLVNYGKAGTGSIIFEFIEVDGKMELCYVKYFFPVNRKGNKEIYEKIIKRLNVEAPFSK